MIDDIRQFIKDKAIEFGAKPDVEFNKPYIERNNTSSDALKDNGAYFGLIHPNEDVSGPYHDFSKIKSPLPKSITGDSNLQHI